MRPYLLFSILLLLALGTSLSAQTYSVSGSLSLEDSTQLHIVYLRNGDRLLGRITGFNKREVQFRLRYIEEIMIFPAAEVEALGYLRDTGTSDRRPGGNDGLPDQLLTEDLFYTQTALPQLVKRRYRNTLLLANSIDWQLGKNANLGVGAILPIGIYIPARLHTEVLPKVHIGLNNLFFLNVLNQGDAPLVGDISAVATLGTHHTYLNVGYGYFYSVTGGNPATPGVRLGGGTMVGPRLRLYVDLIYVLDEFEEGVLPFIGGSFAGRRARVDLALLPIVAVFDDFPLIVPVASGTFYF
ncbi:MAG: hypothetical protein WBA17_14470 [Saprospiraceae bacterium]